jgi:hypothetical protein
MNTNAIPPVRTTPKAGSETGSGQGGGRQEVDRQAARAPGDSAGAQRFADMLERAGAPSRSAAYSPGDFLTDADKKRMGRFLRTLQESNEKIRRMAGGEDKPAENPQDTPEADGEKDDT